FEEHPDFAGVIHFAALKDVGESVFKPLSYFRNNLNSLFNILECMSEFGTTHFIFSSSCSVYGNIETLPATEAEPLKEPESPYARTKQMGEAVIRDFCVSRPGFSSVLLRYFNPAGAHESALIGESPANRASNLVPVITETAIGKRPETQVFGNDYPTRDGSCIRDYIHVMDLANAHTKALEYLLDGRSEKACEIFNLGAGEGVTVLEAIAAFEHATGQQLNYHIGPRRPGDVVAIYANYEKAARVLGWRPTRDMEAIMKSAWAWEKVRG
ncbi:MAG: UDP-glucose 4-epimerase GalE, partial [Saprospiraceae bacterium]|nr:UDP-glucose 4-epimerase GalE [Saprospiraceae bacterium]